MEITSLDAAPAHDPERFVAASLLEGRGFSVRAIRLGPGQELPPHRHGTSEVVLLVLEGTATLEGPDGPVELPTSGIAHLQGDEELRAANRGDAPVTLVAFLTPPFPPRG